MNGMEYPIARKKVVVILGATASGKTRLSIEIATKIPCEIINSDKIQFFKGLDITTNKVSLEERLGVPHHLIGNIDSSLTTTHNEISTTQYRCLGSLLISEITNRGNLPIVVGGSNSFVYSLLAKEYNPKLEVFSESSEACFELGYDCCFLWVYVSPRVLNKYINKRVDEMLKKGMLNELAEFRQLEDDMVGMLEASRGIGKAIGVEEFKEYLERYGVLEGEEEAEKRKYEYEKAVKATKENTCELARKQVERIKFLKNKGWKINMLDATNSVRALLELEGSQAKGGSFHIWETEVLEPSLNIVKTFLQA